MTYYVGLVPVVLTIPHKETGTVKTTLVADAPYMNISIFSILI